MNIDLIRKNAPPNATHYSQFRNEYYSVPDTTEQVVYCWIDDIFKWELDDRAVPLDGEWINLSHFNTGYWTEGLDRIHTIQLMIGELLGNGVDYHPAIEKAGLQKQVDKLLYKTNKLYQKLGAAIPDSEW